MTTVKKPVAKKQPAAKKPIPAKQVVTKPAVTKEVKTPEVKNEVKPAAKVVKKPVSVKKAVPAAKAAKPKEAPKPLSKQEKVQALEIQKQALANLDAGVPQNLSITPPKLVVPTRAATVSTTRPSLATLFNR